MRAPLWISRAKILTSITSAVLMYAAGAWGNDLSRDHREALERGCRSRFSETVQYRACLQGTLERATTKGRTLADTRAIDRALLNDIRLACVGAKDGGLLAYDDCLKRQLVRLSGTPDALRPSLPREEPGPPTSNRWVRNLEPATLFEITSPSVYFVVAAKSRDSGNASMGSAVAITDSLLLTNCHVLGDANVILLSDGTNRWPVVRRHTESTTDRCILESQNRKVNAVRETRPYLDLRVGERVYTIGNPSGFLNTLADGLVSGLRERDGMRLVQTTAPIAPGSSGGGLFDSSGRLIGITTFLVGLQGSLHFAIAADEFLALPPFRTQ